LPDDESLDIPMILRPANVSRRHFLGGLAALPFLPLIPSETLARMIRRALPDSKVPASFAPPSVPSGPPSLWEVALNHARQNKLTAYERALRNGPCNAFLNNPQRFARQIAFAQSSPSILYGMLVAPGDPGLSEKFAMRGDQTQADSAGTGSLIASSPGMKTGVKESLHLHSGRYATITAERDSSHSVVRSWHTAVQEKLTVLEARIIAAMGAIRVEAEGDELQLPDKKAVMLALHED
jgi:hypothetical protein